ncbi:transcriptional regulator RpiR family [Clostridium aceticum]|uniref:Transcriptional regulator RpiR family n=1 Tax=Clostridium aceticum TaxID=84022 RepID=A0A0D8IBB5_9CLOT|nr:MurR/RpiR family transcriptional regulator [Clostridium aceticum]AKL96484.1 transcriptional regulator RpiR family [Clostridium aceticum]KJF27344.1 hypothetical protein TZ02_08385 [Clostridium aceticum]
MENNFFQRLNENKDKFTKKQQLLAKYIVENYNDAVFLSCTELGKKVHTSDATVIRFAYVLGYSGYSEMMRSLQSCFEGDLPSASRIDKLHGNNGEHFTHVNFDKIQSCLMIIVNHNHFKSLIKDILNCSKLILIGSESTSSIANYLNYHLIRYGVDSEVINNNSESIYKTYHRVDKNSLVLSLALRRYTKFQYNLTNRFIERNVKTYSITDDIRSPYNAINNKCIVLNSATKEGFNHLSHIVLMLTLQEIINKVIVYQSKSVIKRQFESLEEYNNRMDIFIKDKF